MCAWVFHLSIYHLQKHFLLSLRWIFHLCAQNLPNDRKTNMCYSSFSFKCFLSISFPFSIPGFIYSMAYLAQQKEKKEPEESKRRENVARKWTKSNDYSKNVGIWNFVEEKKSSIHTCKWISRFSMRQRLHNFSNDSALVEEWNPIVSSVNGNSL